jgi:hypothetical protein
MFKLLVTTIKVFPNSNCMQTLVIDFETRELADAAIDKLESCSNLIITYVVVALYPCL